MTKGKTKFFLEFNLPYAILTGQSGIGKTTLINALNSPSSVIESPLIFIPFTEKHPRESWEVYFRRYTGEYIGYADEDFTLSTTKEFQENAVKYKANLLLVTRRYIRHLPLSISDLYTIRSNDGFIHELISYSDMYKESVEDNLIPVLKDSVGKTNLFG